MGRLMPDIHFIWRSANWPDHPEHCGHFTDFVEYFEDFTDLTFSVEAGGSRSKHSSSAVRNRVFTSAWELTQKGEKRIINLTTQLIVMEVRSPKLSVVFKAQEKRYFTCNSYIHLAIASSISKKGLGRNDETQEVCYPYGTCKKSNNLEKDCYFKNMQESKGDQEEKKKVCFLTENNRTKQWILDSRTTSHMVNKLEYLKE
ncbi:hypothetical protein WN48_03462 [Eufriesea mexicana]|nr:hypothetical protein WN48_03462 [Eufriesea mexicana]